MSASQTQINRGGSALRGAVAAGAATAILLGGFGAFALWSESQNAGAAGTIQTGQLALDPIAGPVQWMLENPQDGGPAVPVDLATFMASPGDSISYEILVNASVTGTNITADLDVDLDRVVLDPTLAPSDVIISVVGAQGDPIEIVGTPEGASFSEPVTVRVEFDDEMVGAMNLPKAVDVDGLELVLQQREQQ